MTWKQEKIFAWIGVVVAWLLIIATIFLQGCMGAWVYRQNCVDKASSAGHTYERMFEEPAMVATGMSGSKFHAQAYCIKDDKMVWLTTTYATDFGMYGHYGHGAVLVLAVGVDSELDTIDSYFTLEEFDEAYNSYRRKKYGLR